MNKTYLISYPIQSKISGTIFVPGDKSISHRSIILGSIAHGITIVNGCLYSEDCLSTINGFRSMGVNIEKTLDSKIIIYGVGKYGLHKPKDMINCGNSATTMRLMSGILSAQSFNCILDGDRSLQKRPMYRIIKPLTKMGARIYSKNMEYAPLFIYGSLIHGILYKIPEPSAQVKSCLLFAGMYATGKTQIIESYVTRDHTERSLKNFLYPIKRNKNLIIIHSNSEHYGANITIPGDISSAAFFIVSAIIIPNSKLTIVNVGINPSRIGIIHILNMMGANIKIKNKRLLCNELVADIYVQSSKLIGIYIPSYLRSITIDEFPIIFIAAACAIGNTILQGAQELEYKESNRISVMLEGLNKIGIQTFSHRKGEICIVGGTLQGGEINSYNDHRVAMSFAIAGAAAKNPIIIKNCACIYTSFPNFITLATKIKLSIIERKY